jgi:hypothetical protein
MGLPHPDEHAILADALAKARRVLSDLQRQAADLREHAERVAAGVPSRAGLTVDVLATGRDRLAGAIDAVRATVAALEDALARPAAQDQENPTR